MTNFQRIKNYFLIFVVFFTVLGSSYVFISTVYELQFTNSDYFKNQALSYRVKTEKLKASRGNIYDKNLLILSSSSRSYNIGIFPTKIDNLDEVVNSLSAILFLEKDLLHKRIISTPNFFYLDRNIDYERGEEIKSWNLEGVVLEPSFDRIIHTNSVSKIIGKVDPDENGIEGLELYFDSSLKGIDGEIRYEASPNGKIIPQAPINTIQPTHGKDLILTLDSELQFISENLCSEALEKTKDNKKRELRIAKFHKKRIKELKKILKKNERTLKRLEGTARVIAKAQKAKATTSIENPVHEGGGKLSRGQLADYRLKHIQKLLNKQKKNKTLKKFNRRLNKTIKLY